VRDIWLWKLLAEPAADPTELSGLLCELAAAPLKKRAIYFGRMQPALMHPSEAVRAAAVSTLDGADGVLAYRHLAAALNDPSPPVYLAAVAALFSSAHSDSSRFVHAVFHNNPEVRRAVAEMESLHPLALFLLADETCAGQIVDRMKPEQLSAKHLPALLDFAARKECDAALSRRLLYGAGIAKLTHWLAENRVRNDEQDRAILSALRSGDLPDSFKSHASDPVDQLIDLFWNDEAIEHAMPDEILGASAEFFARLSELVLKKNNPAGMHYAAAVALVAAKKSASTGENAWTQPAVSFCALLWPQILACEDIDRTLRHGAIEGFFTTEGRCKAYDLPLVTSLMTDELCRRESGHLDLWAIGGLLHLLDDPQPISRMLDRFGLDAVVEAFHEAPLESAGLLTFRDDSKHGRQYLIRALHTERQEQRWFYLALMIHSVTADDLEFLESLTPEECVATCVAVLDLLQTPGLKLSPNKIRVTSEILGHRIMQGAIEPFLSQWLGRTHPEKDRLAIDILAIVARRAEGGQVAVAMLALPEELLKKGLRAISWCAGFSYSVEVAIALELRDHPDEEVRSWANDRAADPAAKTWDGAASAKAENGSPLPNAASKRIAECSDAELTAALKPCMESPRTGVCDALSQRRSVETNAAACVAVIGSQDDSTAIDVEFHRFCDSEPDALARLDQQIADVWSGQAEISMLGNAWLCRWERHAFRLADMLTNAEGDLLQALAYADGLVSPVLQTMMWQAIVRVFGLWRFREAHRLPEVFTLPLAQLLVERLSSPQGVSAARILMCIHRELPSNTHLAEVREPAIDQLADLPAPVLAELRGWIDSRGVKQTVKRPRAESAALDAATLGAVVVCEDLSQLESWCRSPHAKLVQEACLRLLELESPGVDRLAQVLGDDPPAPAFATIAESIALWPAGAPLVRITELAEEHAQAHVRFRLCLGLLEREDSSGRARLLESAIDAVCAPCESVWFERDDWSTLLHFGAQLDLLAAAMAVSPHPLAYTQALAFLFEHGVANKRTRGAVLNFLHCGDDRSHTLRLRAAHWLRSHGETSGFPLLVEQVLTDEKAKHSILSDLPGELVEATAIGAMTVGGSVFREALLHYMLTFTNVDPTARDKAYELLLCEGRQATVRERVVKHLANKKTRAKKLRSVAEQFAWGVQIGRELTSRLFRVEMIAGEGLGYTRFTENKIYINPIPILRGEKHAADIVQGLILHELGHHMYHRGEAEQAIWKAAGEDQLHELLNLVSDEHLERRLRALDGDFGDKIKRLGSYAFQHSAREISVDQLLSSLSSRAFAVLSSATLNVARAAGCVQVESGRILLEMEQAGMSFARFFRALRMGLGNRHNDPKVAEGLKLFRGKFRNKEMPDLLAIAKRLREIFGAECQILNTFSQDALCAGDAGELAAKCEGFSNEELQSEIRRITDPRELDQMKRGEGGGGGRVINMLPDEDFETITDVIPMPYDPTERARYAEEVARNAKRMRRYLQELGLAHEAVGKRSTGRRLDRSQLQNLVLRGEPRILMARRTKVQTDLFLGVVIDCSGSMSFGDHMEQAKLFGSLLAEAAKGFRGIDLRLFGFTDSQIFDCGDANRPSVHALSAGGGNNDAAALWHAALTATASPRKAKLLVMISDGLPTECSAAALTALVRRLTNRMKICCAQVAVQPLDEICFPHYVCLSECDLETSIRRFGAIVGRLVGRVIGR